MEDFKEDIAVEILSRLPKKSRARFKCVCKQWLALISDCNGVFPTRTFWGLVCQASFTPPMSAHVNFRMDFLHIDSKNSHPEYDSQSNLGETHSLMASCNGFLLFCNQSPTWLRKPNEYWVYHPATNRSWHVVPPPSVPGNIPLGLASCGDHHFKLVKIFLSPVRCREYEIRSQVYSSQSEEWEDESWAFGCGPTRHEGYWVNPVFAKGSLLWMCGRYLLIYHIKDGFCEFALLPRADHGRCCISESEGCFIFCNITSTDAIRIWTLNGGNRSSWKLKHKGFLVSSFLKNRGGVPFQPIAYNDDLSIVYLMGFRQQRIFSYDLATRQVKEAFVIPYNYSLRTALPFLFHSPFAIAAMAMSDGEMCNPCSDEILKRRKLH